MATLSAQKYKKGKKTAENKKIQRNKEDVKSARARASSDESFQTFMLWKLHENVVLGTLGLLLSGLIVGALILASRDAEPFVGTATPQRILSGLILFVVAVGVATVALLLRRVLVTLAAVRLTVRMRRLFLAKRALWPDEDA